MDLNTNILSSNKMEHSDNLFDFGYIKHIGYSETNDCIAKYFDSSTVKLISYKITQLLAGVDSQNRPIVVPDSTIVSVMNDIYDGYRPPTGDIYSRYNIPSGTTSESYVQNMIDQVIEVITSYVRNTLEMEENNRKLSVWTTVYGDFNEHGLQQHSQIKVQNKRPNPFMFNMNY
jgi:hypothetical protein